MRGGQRLLHVALALYVVDLFRQCAAEGEEEEGWEGSTGAKSQADSRPPGEWSRVCDSLMHSPLPERHTHTKQTHAQPAPQSQPKSVFVLFFFLPPYASINRCDVVVRLGAFLFGFHLKKYPRCSDNNPTQTADESWLDLTAKTLFWSRLYLVWGSTRPPTKRDVVLTTYNTKTKDFTEGQFPSYFCFSSPSLFFFVIVVFNSLLYFYLFFFETCSFRASSVTLNW